ncbi:RidA family protein [Tenacibaculum sp. nBUS_03]|uniref:RidA family protein n=1 Tax=Tenacibaculum sp. nBUS_03 TaxID=3395320 RepID=UPI003EB6CCAE
MYFLVRTYSLATIAPKNAQMIYVSGINAYGKNGHLPLEEQLQTIFKKLNKILKEAGSKPECITMIKQYTTRMDNEFFEIFLRERDKFLKGAKPSSALIPMAKPNKNSIDIEIELVCYKCD